MKTSLTLFGAIWVVALFLSSCETKNTDGQNAPETTSADSTIMKTERELRAANDQLYAALNAMFTGDLEPMISLWSHSDNITNMGPFGGRLTGWDAVHEEFIKEAAMKFGGRITCKDLHVYAGTDMGYTVCIEEGENMSADGKPIQ